MKISQGESNHNYKYLYYSKYLKTHFFFWISYKSELYGINLREVMNTIVSFAVEIALIKEDKIGREISLFDVALKFFFVSIEKNIFSS